MHSAIQVYKYFSEVSAGKIRTDVERPKDRHGEEEDGSFFNDANSSHEGFCMKVYL